MEAEITKEGTLIIKSETGVEAYALSKWNENYLQGGENSTLMIVANVEKPNNKGEQK